MNSVSKLFDNRFVRWAFIAGLALLAAVSVFQGARNALEYSQDFQWDAAKAFCMGLDPYELSLDPAKTSDYPELAEFYAMFTDRGLKQKMEANQFPSLLMLLAPMTVFPPEVAKAVWLVLNMLFTAGIIILLKKTFFENTGIYAYAVLALVMLAGTPYRNQLGVGQHTLFAFFFFMLAVFFDKGTLVKSKGANGLLIALCLFVSYFKYTLTAPLALYFLYRKRYRELALSVAGHVVLTGVAALWLDRSFLYMIKAPLTVASALMAEGGIDLGVLLGGASFAVAGIIAVALFVLAVIFPAGSEDVLFPVLVLWSLVLTYHRTYDFFVLTVVGMMFACYGAHSGSEDHTDGKKAGDTAGNVFFIWYWILTVLIYFVFRIFNENLPSKAVIGVCYYAFTLAVTYTGIRLAIKYRKQGRKNG